MEENNVLEQCPICFEDLSSETYTLECNHKFHINCIVKWFRNDNSTCPLCKDIHTYDDLSYWTKIETISEIKKLGRKKSCPDGIKKILNKIKKLKEKQKKFRKYCKEFTDNNKQLIKEHSKIRRTRWEFPRKIRKLERQLLHFITISPIYIKK